MTSPVQCISAETTLQEAVDIMGANDVDCLPVVTGAFLVGMVTRAALALAEQGATTEPCDACGRAVAAGVGDDTDELHLCGRCLGLLQANGRC